MLIRKSKRTVTKARIGMTGPSGSGKTLTALLMAFGMTDDWEKIGLIDTENRSADLYAETTKAGVQIPEFLKIDLEPPYTTEKYIEAIKAFEDYGVEAIIVDSLSHAWAGEGGIIEQKDKLSKTKNSFTAWGELTPKQNKMVEAILQCSAHIFVTMRSKTEYVLEANEKGKQVPRKVGMAPVQRDGLEYEFTLVMDLSAHHIATVSKDRTGLFDGLEFIPGVETGQQLAEWLESGEKIVSNETAEGIKAAWEALGQKPEKIDAQTKKLYGFPLLGITEKQGIDFLGTLTESIKEKEVEGDKGNG
ncbi:AAA family ATPase [Paenibacillus polymyxa]|uniref:AAA family ATPase n=1 Tax=Paenibacillus polymyxa TaxID=1406 RepID=UPI0025B688E3|nr:AAA family ATPase [Paenibacillus polymyxa]MDN4085927.1 AAA family ATPase [Paenibacillus polymyxa]MDN4111829.1 AAA family ATPase [Paenibacillus polymyxa]